MCGCKSATPGPPVNPVAPVVDLSGFPTSQQQAAKPQHECVGSSGLSQYYVVERARLEGEPSAHLNYCFTSGYRGIDCPDDYTITHVVGRLSNRERAGCDAIMRRMERQEAAERAQKKKLDEAYDKAHGLKPAN